MSRLATCIATILCALAATSGTAAALPSGFDEEPMVTGLTRPTVVDWTPDGRMLIGEQDGVLKVVAAGQSTAQTVLDLRSQVNSAGDRGLLGLAVDTDFASNGYVYLLYVRELAPGTPDVLAPMSSRLRRIKLAANNAVLEQQTILGAYDAGPCPAPQNSIDCLPADGETHTIGTVRSAPDGTLFVGSGDAADYNAVDQLAFRSYDERSLAGKIVHIDRDGNGLPGHPFCPSNTNLSEVCAKLWAKGFRNPFRFSLSPTGGLIVGDVGWGDREEIDIVASGGGSYGWPCVEGTGPNSYSSDPKCQPGQLGPQLPPIYDYPHPSEGPPDAAVVGGPMYSGTEYPAAYQGSIIFGDYARGLLRRLSFDGPTPSEHPISDDWWGGVDIETAPDNGDIVSVNFGDGDAGEGSIVRLVYAPGNARPVASATAAPLISLTAPVEVDFDGSESSDADPSDTLDYLWEFGDGDTSTAVSPSHTYTDPGLYTATLTVDDGRGKSDTDSVTIAVGNSPPDEPEIDHAPTYRGGDEIQLHGSATDEQDGELGPEALTWDVKLIHSDHTHPFFHDRPGADLTFTDPAGHDANSHYEIRLTATDAGGLTSSRVVEMNPETTTITLASEPPGARISYYDTTFTAPLTRTTAIGLQTGVVAEERFVSGGQEYLFSSWSDGGARTHSLTVPDQPVELVARYAAVAGPPAPDDNSPSGSGGDGPLVSFAGPATLTVGQTTLKGRASDSDGVRRVLGAVYRHARHGRCRFWSARRARLLAPRRCDRPVWIEARLSGPANRRTWRLPLRAPLPHGAYRVRIRALDRDGARSTRVAGLKSIRLAPR